MNIKSNDSLRLWNCFCFRVDDAKSSYSYTHFSQSNQFLFNKITYFFHWISHAACKYFCWIKWVTNVACWLQRFADARLKLACLAGCVSARSPEILSVFKSLSIYVTSCLQAPERIRHEQHVFLAACDSGRHNSRHAGLRSVQSL